MMEFTPKNVALFCLAWFAVSVPIAWLMGRFCALSSEPQKEKEPGSHPAQALNLPTEKG